MELQSDHPVIDLTDSDSGEVLVIGGERHIVELDESDLLKFEKCWKGCNFKIVKDGIDKISQKLKARLSKIYVELGVSKLPDHTKRQESEIIALTRDIFRYANDSTIDYFRLIDSLLCTTIVLSEEFRWNTPATTRQLRDLFYVEYKQATRDYINLVINLSCHPQSYCGDEYRDWILNNRLTRLAEMLAKETANEIGKKEKSLATRLLIDIYCWGSQCGVEIENSKQDIVIEDIFALFVLERNDMSYDVHVGEPTFHGGLAEPGFESHCRCQASQSNNNLHYILGKIWLRGNRKTKKLLLDRALSEPHKLESISSWASESIIFNSKWSELSKILDEHVLPRLKNDNVDIRTKAAWMINICINDNVEELEHSAKYLLALLEFLTDKCSLLRRQCHIAWFKVLFLTDYTPTLASLKETFLNKILENIKNTSIRLTRGYDVTFRSNDSKKCPTLSCKICLISFTLLQTQLNQRVTGTRISRQLVEYFKKAAPASSGPDTVEKKFLDQFSVFRKLYSGCPEVEKRLDLVEKALRSNCSK